MHYIRQSLASDIGRICPAFLARIVSLSAVLALALLSIPAHADTALEFCYDPYPPYTISIEGVLTGGLKVELLEAVVDRIEGVEATVILLPWKRCQAEAKSGRVDGILPLFKNAEREDYLAFTDAAFNEETRFWYNRDRFPRGLTWDASVDELSSLKLGMLNGGYIDGAMQKAFDEKQGILRAKDVHALMQMLLSDRVDLIATDAAVGNFEVQKMGWVDRIASVEHAITKRTSHFGLSKASGADQYLADFNRALAELHESGAVDAIYNRIDPRQ